MKTFGLYLLLFMIVTISIAVGLKDWTVQETLLQGTLLSYIMYRLIKETVKED